MKQLTEKEIKVLKEDIAYVQNKLNMSVSSPKRRVPTSRVTAEEINIPKSKQDLGETVNYAKNKEGFFPAPITCNAVLPGVYEPVYSNGIYGFRSVTISCDDFVPLNENHVMDVFADIQKFWKSEAAYSKLKLIHKRGILLYGEPGCGKTHTINKLIEIAIDNEGVVMLGHLNPDSTIAAIRLIKSVEPAKKIMVILEDIDSLFKKFEESSFLQMLDGGLQVTNVVFVATTNHPELLHDRITNRPSRFDLSIQIGKPNDESRKLFILSKFSQIDYDGDVDMFVKKTEDLTISHIKEVILSVCVMGYDLDQSLKRIIGMKKPRIDKNDRIGFQPNGNH